jgi:hypothetical protein
MRLDLGSNPLGKQELVQSHGTEFLVRYTAMQASLRDWRACPHRAEMPEQPLLDQEDQEEANQMEDSEEDQQDEEGEEGGGECEEMEPIFTPVGSFRNYR